MIRLVYTTACHDISELDFTIRTECAAFIADAQIDSVWVADSTTGHVLARIVDRAQDGDPRNNPEDAAVVEPGADIFRPESARCVKSLPL